MRSLLPRPARRRGALALVAGLAMVSLGVWLYLATRPTPPRRAAKVVLVGVDGATFSVLDPLVARGRLPNFARLLETGSRGVLRAQGGLISPPIWTTVVTGHRPSRHGVHGFFYRGDGGQEVLIDSTRRRVGALWNWMGPLGRSTGFAGWWASWPAEPVEGWMISDRFARNQWSAWPGGVEDARLNFPPGLARELADTLYDPQGPLPAELAALAPFTAAELARLAALEKPVPYDGLSDLKFAFLSQRSYEEATLALLGREQPDLTGVFLIATDPVSHRYWHLYEPSAFEGVDPAEVERLGELIPTLYEHADRFLGRLLSAVEPSTLVLVISDHGFEASGDLSGSGQHHRDGILVAAGGPARTGGRVEARMIDVAPTILRAMELPIPDDLPGRVLEEILDPGFLAARPERRVPSLAPLWPLRDAAGAEGTSPSGRAPGDREMRELLRSLGYLD